MSLQVAARRSRKCAPLGHWFFATIPRERPLRRRVQRRSRPEMALTRRVCRLRRPEAIQRSPRYQAVDSSKGWLASRTFLFALLLSCFLGIERGSCAELQRIGIVSAFDPELKAVEEVFIPKGRKSKIEEVNGTRFRSIDLNGKRLYFFLSGVSMVNAALTTQMAIDHFQLDAIIFSGIAGAVDPGLHPGDVVVPGRWIHQIESNWLNPDSTKPGSYILPEFYRPKYGHFEMIFPSDVEVVRKGENKSRQVHAFPADHYLLGCAKSVANRVQLVDSGGGRCKVYVGGNAMSGPVFLDNRSFREFAFHTWRVRLHEMEGTAIAQVGYVNRVPVLIIRGISDLAGGQRGPNWEERYTQLASRNAALVAAAILRQMKSP
jgi:adenosylhomocysteine nucleosidase